MIKKIFFGTLIAVAILIRAPGAYASKEAGASATFQFKEMTTLAHARRAQFKKREAIRRILERRGSPLVAHIDDFIKTCQEQNLDCYLLPSITGLESSFGHAIAPGTYNPFGWGGGYIVFKSWGDGIDTVGTGLRQNYINRGATSIEAIGRIYAASPTWAVRVRGFMGEFEAEEAKISSLPAGLDIQ